MKDQIFHRTQLLLGDAAMQRLADTCVIIFGVGGVGSWCAEGLVRSGIRHLTIVDADRVAPTNINRQLMATTLTIGQPKVEALRQRLLTINPDAEITARNEIFCEETADTFHVGSYHYVIDAIDSLRHKATLILTVSQTEARLYSSMGAALKTDPARIRVAEFWKVQGDPLARALRKKFKAMQHFPERKFLCVFSDEQIPNQPIPELPVEDPSPFDKPHVNGSLAHITAIFGFTLAGLVIQSEAGQ